MLSSRFGLRSQLLTALLLALMALVALLLMVLAGQQAITVGGPLDHQLQRDRALLAALSPSPLYVVEAVGHVEELMNGDSAATFGEALIAIKAVQSRFDQARQQWAGIALSTAAAPLFSRAMSEADSLFALIEQQLVPALRDNQRQQARQPYLLIRDAFVRHRAALEELQPLLASELAASQQRAAAQAVRFTQVVIAVAVALMLLVSAFMLWSCRDLLRRLGADMDHLIERLRFGDLAGHDGAARPVPPGSVLAEIELLLLRGRVAGQGADQDRQLRQLLEQHDGRVMLVDGELQILLISSRLQSAWAAQGSDESEPSALPVVGSNLGQWYPAADAPARLSRAAEYGSRVRLTLGGVDYLLAVRRLAAGDGQLLGLWLEWLNADDLARQTRAAQRQRFNSLRAMVIESRAAMRAHQVKLLSAIGMVEVDEVSQGEEVERLLALHTYDVIICDWEMTGMTALSLLTRLRANPATATVPFVMCTSVASREGIMAAVAAGATDYIVKPFEPRVFQEKLARLLLRQQAGDKPQS